MSYNVIISHSARKVIKRLDKPARERIIKHIKEIQISPWIGDIKPIKGCTGDWRIIYAVDKDQLVIMILKVSPRGDAYKNR